MMPIERVLYCIGLQRSLVRMRDVRRLARSTRKYRLTPQEERPSFIDPFKHLSVPLVLWVFLKGCIDQPTLFALGTPLAILAYVALAAQLLAKLLLALIQLIR